MGSTAFGLSFDVRRTDQRFSDLDIPLNKSSRVPGIRGGRMAMRPYCPIRFISLASTVVIFGRLAELHKGR